MLKKKKFVISIVLGMVLSIAVVGGVVFASDSVSRNIKVTIYTPNSNADGLVKSTATVSKIRPTLILNEMSKKMPELKDVKALGFVQKHKHVDLNLSTEFQTALCNNGTAGEELLMASVVNTMLEACKATTISIKVKGKVIETGHCIYDEPLTFYTFENDREFPITIYTPNSNADGLVKSAATVSKIRPTLILDEMSKKMPELKDVKALGFVQNQKHVDLDLSTEFQTALCNNGTAGEELLMASVVNTMLEACNATTISIKVKGKVIETGHCIYDKPLTFYTFDNDREFLISIYSSNANADGFVKSTATVSKLRPTLILNEMSKKIPELKNVRALGFVQNKGHIDLNLSEEFEKELCKYGTAGEYMLMGSVVNTFLEACNASTISIRVKGHIIETGHCIYSEPLEFYK